MAGKVTPLANHHKARGARFTEFGGWQMPVQYKGIIEEHLAVRRACGLFDLSHMGEIEIRGPLALDFAQGLMTNDVSKLAPGRVQYSLLCNETGGIIDDLLVYRHPDYVTLAVNASNTDKDLDWLQRMAARPPYRGKVEVLNVGERRAILAIQGPQAPKVMRSVGLDVLDLPYMAFRLLGQNGEIMVSRTGYTGEIGYELYMPASDAVTWWERFLGLANSVDIEPVGLGARDTLRLEMGYTLYGNDIDETTTPWEAGIGWAVKLDKEFIGRTALLEAKAQGPQRRLVGFVVEGRGIARPGYPVYIEGELRGEVTSGCISPSSNRPVGLAYVDSAWAEAGTSIEILVRGRAVAGRITSVPFMPSRVRDAVTLGD
ncbi:MAG: glycine cleavage system aminomethyltransferase GcvT [Firmicutes bacterium]|nr:glycine cleavage system aminomethyltransferase GcvT [Bacillota bacterium]